MKTTDLWPIARLIALIIQVPGLMALISIAVAAAAGDMLGVLAFATTALAAIALGLSLYWLLPAGHQPDFREAMAGCAAGWLVAALIGTVPFVLVAYWSSGDEAAAVLVFRDFWNALFESMSGFTTTGLTMVERPSQLPVGLQWWRSFMQWIGGLGVIVLVLAVVQPSGELSKLLRAEGHERTFGQNIVTTVRQTWWIYAAFTMLGVVLLKLLGMSSWASINHAMTAISTGGFTITDGGLAGYGSGPRFGVVFLTILGAISFVWHQHLFSRDWFKCWGDGQTRTLLGVLAVGAALLILTRFAGGHGDEPLTVALHWTSAVTTSGFSASRLEGWSDAAKMLLIVAMIVGGCTGSAAGGIKILRIVTLVSEIAVFLKAIVVKPWLLVFRPATLAQELNTELTGRFTVAALFAVLWVGTIAFSGYLVALLAGPDVALTDVIFDVTSALSITGLSTGVAAPALGAGGKAIFVLLMWMGRLEMISVLVFLAWLAGIRAESDAKTKAK